MYLPEKYRRRLRPANMKERLDEEIRRRELVVQVSLNERSALRPIGALLAETADSWQKSVYLDRQQSRESQTAAIGTPAAFPIAI